MTNLLRKAIGIALLLSLFVPLHITPSVAAQSTLDGSACWQPGQLSIAGASMTWAAPPATIIDPTQTYTATLQTTAGVVTVALDAAHAPIATNNFICLALAGYYTGTDFHRIFAGTLIQGGDPTAAGTGNPGYTVPSDPTTGSYPAGSVAMANAAPDQNGSQFFIAAADLTGRIPDQYPVFGQVTSGMDVVLAISNGAVTSTASGEQSKPIDPSVLSSVTIEISGQTGAPVGPVVAQPTATAIPPTPPAAGDAQTRPGSVPAATSPTPAPDVAGCAGFDEYTGAFDDAYFQTALQYPDALAFLMSLQDSDNTQSIFDLMTAEQASAMSAFYYGLADTMTQISPPPYATEWHAIQTEIFRALGDFTDNIASQGLTIASIQASPILIDLTNRSDAAIAGATAVCAEFGPWATGESGE